MNHCKLAGVLIGLFFSIAALFGAGALFWFAGRLHGNARVCNDWTTVSQTCSSTSLSYSKCATPCACQHVDFTWTCPVGYPNKTTSYTMNGFGVALVIAGLSGSCACIYWILNKCTATTAWQDFCSGSKRRSTTVAAPATPPQMTADESAVIGPIKTRPRVSDEESSDDEESSSSVQMQSKVKTDGDCRHTSTSEEDSSPLPPRSNRDESVDLHRLYHLGIIQSPDIPYGVNDGTGAGQ
jgi:hypothetical protein